MTTTYPEKQADKQDAAEVKNYTRTPNMLIFGYRSISPQEKWLYTCLKHMCGKKGTRHLSLRYISEQTGISTGALSTSKDKKGNVNLGMIRHLHDAGLIHSEIKKHDGKGNAQYHITITDIWVLNQEFFKTRPKSEQVEGDDVNLSEFRTDSSEFRTDTTSTRPKSEQTCPNSSTILRLDNKTTDITKITEQDESGGDSAIADHAPAFLPHPKYDFILFDDLEVPTLMVVKLLSEDASTDEDKYRIHTAAWGVMPRFLERGLKVELRYEQETPTPTHIDEQQANAVSYSPGTPGNALSENGAHHEHRESLHPSGQHRDHPLNADDHHVPADLRSAQGTTQAQQQITHQEIDNNSHSHSQEKTNGLMDEPTAGNLGNSRPATLPRGDRNPLTQDARTDTRRTTDTGSAEPHQHSRGSGRTLHADTSAETRQSDTTPTRDKDTGDASVQEVAPHQGRAQIPTDSDGVPGKKPRKKAVDKNSKATDTDKKPVEPPSEADLLARVPQPVVSIIMEWQHIFTKHVPVTPYLIEQAKLLSAWQPTPGEIAACRLWMYANDKKGYYRARGMKLGDVNREFEGFRSLDCIPATLRSSGPGRQISSFDDPNYDMSVEFYPSEAEKAARRMQHAGQC